MYFNFHVNTLIKSQDITDIVCQQSCILYGGINELKNTVNILQPCVIVI